MEIKPRLGSVFYYAKYPEVVNFAALPPAATKTGDVYLVITTTGTWPFSKKYAGLYRSDGINWNYLGDLAEVTTLQVDSGTYVVGYSVNLISGSGITLTPDAPNTKITIAANYSTLDSRYLKLDQTTPQTLTDSPYFNNLTTGRIVFVGASKNLTDDIDLIWDSINNRLGIGVAIPAYSIDAVAGIRTGTNFYLPTTTSVAGQILVNSVPRVHFYGTDSVFICTNSGNFTYTGAGKNIGIGANTLTSITSTYGTVAIGDSALKNATSAYSNVAIGSEAMSEVTTLAYNNIALGPSGPLKYISGSSHVAIGAGCADRITSGESCVFIGNGVGRDGSRGTISNITSSILIGNSTVCFSNSKCIIGSVATTVSLGINDPDPVFAIGIYGNAAKTIGIERTRTSALGRNLTIQSGGAVKQGAIVALNRTPTAGGTGYSIGDILTITTGGTLGKAVVIAIGGSGNVTDVQLCGYGSGYTTGTGKATSVSPAGGSSCTLEITTIGAATNLNGGNLLLSSGIATGNGSSEIQFLTVTGNQGSGSTDRNPTQKAVLNNLGYFGIATASPTSHAHISGSLGRKVTTLTDSSTLDSSHNIVLCNKSTAMTITLPAASTLSDRIYDIKNIGLGDVTVDANLAELIDDSLTIILAQWEGITIVCDGTGWYII